MDKSVTISIMIGNSYNQKIKAGESYSFNLQLNKKLKELKEFLYEHIDENKLSEIKKYEFYTKKIIKINDNNILSDFYEEEDNFFIYALLI